MTGFICALPVNTPLDYTCPTSRSLDINVHMDQKNCFFFSFYFDGWFNWELAAFFIHKIRGTRIFYSPRSAVYIERPFLNGTCIIWPVLYGRLNGVFSICKYLIGCYMYIHLVYVCKSVQFIHTSIQVHGGVSFWILYPFEMMSIQHKRDFVVYHI